MYIRLIVVMRWLFRFLGLVKEPEQWRLFRTPLTKVEDIAPRLDYFDYYQNLLSTTYRGQIYTARKLIDENFQIHIRINRDGWVTGHYELQPIHHLAHLLGVKLRKLHQPEITQLRGILIPETV